MLKLLFSNDKYQSKKLNFALLFLRVSLGLVMAFGHGFLKLPVQDGLVQGVAAMGFPFAIAPVAFAWAAALAEFCGGLFIALGLATRLSALLWIFTMTSAAFVVHAADPFDIKERAFLYLFSGIFFLLAGAGKYSVDGAINRA